MIRISIISTDCAELLLVMMLTLTIEFETLFLRSLGFLRLFLGNHFWESTSIITTDRAERQLMAMPTLLKLGTNIEHRVAA